ncbi:unnamed protein product [Phytomonas sp. EM1]|nr:unnamed protein product [Phytomonas sp. EM1]|eukprot:CCW63788.1 unnamed protein product [Phytomonas sp. isolate EM1]
MMRHTFRRLVEFIPVFMPALSPSMESGTIVEWKKKIGDSVDENELLCTVQTDKAVVDYTNPFDAGYLAKIYCQNGESADVSKTIALMVTDANDIAKANEYKPEGTEDASPAPASTSAPAAGNDAASAPPVGTTTTELPEDVECQTIFMPALSPSMESGTIVEWKKKIGDSVDENELLCTVQTDKAVVDYTNPFDAGYLAKIYCQNGESADVSKTIALMVTNADDIPKVANYNPGNATSAPNEAAPTPAKEEATTKSAVVAPQRYGGSLKEAILASGPSVVRLAAGLPEHVLESIVPSGKDGRYAKSDFIGQPGFNYEDVVAATAPPPPRSVDTTTVAAQAQAPLADIYDLVLEAGPILKSVDDTKLLQQLLSTMSVPKPKKASP